MPTLVQVWKTARSWIDGLSRVDWLVSFFVTSGTTSALKLLGSVPLVFSLPLGIIAGCAAFVGLAYRKDLSLRRLDLPAERPESPINFLNAQLVTISSEIERLKPEVIANSVSLYRQALDQAKLDQGQRRVHFVHMSLGQSAGNLSRALAIGGGSTSPEIVPILKAPELKKPECPATDGETLFEMPGNEAYMWAHEENIKAAISFELIVQNKRDELRAIKTQTQQRLLHEWRRIKDASTQS